MMCVENSLFDWRRRDDDQAEAGMGFEARVRGDFFQVALVLVQRDVLVGCAGETGVIGAEEYHLR